MRIPYAWSLGSLTFAREPLARLSCNESQTLLQCTMGKDSRLVWPKLNNCLGMLTAHWKIPLQARSLLKGPIVWTCKTWKKSCFPPLRWSRHWLTDYLISKRCAANTASNSLPRKSESFSASIFQNTPRPSQSEHLR